MTVPDALEAAVAFQFFPSCLREIILRWLEGEARVELFQFFPSCLSTALSAPSCASPTSFNSFPVASELGKIKFKVTKARPAFNSFPAFPVASGERRTGKHSRHHLPFNSFPVASWQRCTGQRIADCADLSILSQLPLLREIGTLVKRDSTFNSFPVASHRSKAGQEEENLHSFQFFPSCLPLTS